MPTATLRDSKGLERGMVELPENLFGAKIHRHLMWQVVTNYLNNQRQGTSQVKTRGMVSGGGRKPFRQKGTGRARQGTSRAAHYRGGGRAFGPIPRDYHVQLPRKIRRQALRSALSVRAKEGLVTVVTDLAPGQGRTREMAAMLRSLGLAGTKCLLILEGNDAVAMRAARNMPLVQTTSAEQVNTYEVLRADHVLITEKAIDVLKEVRL